MLSVLDAARKISRFSSGFSDADMLFQDEKTFDAVLMNFVVIGEAVARLTKEITEVYQDVPWAKIKDFRNIIAHNYFGVDAEEVWQIIQNNLPELKQYIQEIFNAEGEKL